MIRGIVEVLINPAIRPEWRWRVLRKIAGWLMPNYRLPWPQMVWWQDEEFNAFLHRFHEYGGQNSDRRWIIHQLCRLAQSIPGDTAECGVLEGSISYLICKDLPGRTHHMFDSFEGCSAPTGEDNGFFYSGALACGMDVVQQNLKEFSSAVFHKGWIPDRFPDVANRRFAFVHIDVQEQQPTLDSLEFFYLRTNRGGIIVLDDYGFTTCPGARLAIDRFFADKPEPIIELPSGCAFIVKA
jgi:hypothetical protein